MFFKRSEALSVSATFEKKALLASNKLQSLFSNESYFAKEIRTLYTTWEERLVLKKQLILASGVGPGQASPSELSGSISIRQICFPDKLGSPVVNWLTLQI